MLETYLHIDDSGCDYDIVSIWCSMAEDWLECCGEYSVRDIIMSYVENDQHPMHGFFGESIEPDDPRYVEPPDDWSEGSHDWYPANIEIDNKIVEDAIRRCEQNMNRPIGEELRKELQRHPEIYGCR